MKVLIAGGLDFIGSALIRFAIRDIDWCVVNVDKLTYAATPEALSDVEDDARYAFETVDICNGPARRRVFAEDRPDAVAPYRPMTNPGSRQRRYTGHGSRRSQADSLQSCGPW